MAKITWDSYGSKFYELGIDHGVLYTKTGLESSNAVVEISGAVPWNGLTSATVSEENASVSSLYFNGVKTFDIKSNGETKVVIKALTYPEEFNQFNGVSNYGDGLFINNQQPKTFGLSYRTYKADDKDGIKYGYKIHLLYNLTAIEDPISYETINDQVSPIEFSWTLSAKPFQIPRRSPTAYLVIDSKKMHPTILSSIERKLYGDDYTAAYLPEISEILDLLTITITDNGDGTWTAIGPSEFVTNVLLTYYLTNVTGVYSDEYTYTISST